MVEEIVMNGSSGLLLWNGLKGKLRTENALQESLKKDFYFLKTLSQTTFALNYMYATRQNKNTKKVRMFSLRVDLHYIKILSP